MTATPKAIANRVGKTVLIGYRTVHLDRAGETSSLVEHLAEAGETSSLVEHLAEIVAADSSGTIIAVARNGDHQFVPSGRAFVADSSGYMVAGRKRPVVPAFIAVHELFRDFHCVTGRTVRARWLSRKDANRVLRTA
jgi:hypothetical protein